MPASGDPVLLLTNLAGAVCLLLWGSLTVREGVRQGFSAQLSHLLATRDSVGPGALLSGAIVAILTQSATATILLTIALVDSGLMGIATAMAVVLGADLGSAVATRILYLDLSLLPPVLFLVGLVFYLCSTRWRFKCVGRIVIGLGIMLLAIGWIREIIAPAIQTPVSSLWLDVLIAVPWIGMLLVALVTWFGHSSVAAILIVATLDQTGILPIAVTLPMVFGANIGAGLIALPMVATASTSARAVVIGNLILKSGLALVGLLVVSWAAHTEALAGLVDAYTPGTRIIAAHILFNGAVVLIGIVPARAVVHRLAMWLERRQSARENALTRTIGVDLESALLDEPGTALAVAKREALRLGDAAETLFSRTMAMFEAKDHGEVHRLTKLDDEINQRNKVIHRFLSALRPHLTAPEQERELDNILQFSATMEDIGDAVSHDIARLALKRLDRGIDFSSDGRQEIAAIHDQVMRLLRDEINAFSDLASRDAERAGALTESIRQACQASVARHRQRLSASLSNSVASSSIHQDMVRDLLQITFLFQRT